MRTSSKQSWSCVSRSAMVAHERSGAALCKSKAGSRSVAGTEIYRQGVCDLRRPQHHSSDLKSRSCEEGGSDS